MSPRPAFRPLRLSGHPGRLVVALIMITMLAAGRASAELTDAQRQIILAEAQNHYDRGASVLRQDPVAAREAFADAAERFQQLVDDGVHNGRLYYNLGNACLQAGELGRAIFNYRQAEALMPADARLEHNLEYARSLRRDHIMPSGERALAGAMFGWHWKTSTAARFIVFVLAYALFWVLLVAHLYRPTAALRWAAAAAAVLWLIVGTSVSIDLLRGERHRAGVLVVEEVIVRKGNGEGFEPQFEQPLHEGVEFRVLDARGDWLEIELPDEKTGWIRADQASLIGQGRSRAGLHR